MRLRSAADENEFGILSLENGSLNNTDTAANEELAPHEAGTSSGPVPNGHSSKHFMPTYKRLVVFTLTTVLIWMSEPLLSLIDTTFVGRLTRANPAEVIVQIAALGPATTLYDSAIYSTYFLAIAATNVIAPALAKSEWKLLRRSTSQLMGLAAVFGSLVTMIVYGLGKTLIGSMVGTSSSPMEMINAMSIIPLATGYAKIRSTIAPLCVVEFIAQSFCLATQDTTTPVIAVAMASMVNIVGDVLLTPRWGIHGAAFATACASLSSCFVLLRKVRLQLKEWKLLEEPGPPRGIALDSASSSTEYVAKHHQDQEDDMKLSSNAQIASSLTRSLITNGTSDNPLVDIDVNKEDKHRQRIPFFSLPDKKSLLELFQLAGPIFFIMMGQVSIHSALTVRATTFGIVPLASHNILMRVFFFFACFGDALSQAAQTFFPLVAQGNRRKLIKRLFYLCVSVGLLISRLSIFIAKRLGGLLTKDEGILQQLAQHAPYLGWIIFLHPFILLMEGIIVARRDLMFLVGVYIAVLFLHFGLVFSHFATDISGLWRMFTVLQIVRLSLLGCRFATQTWQWKRGNTRNIPMSVE